MARTAAGPALRIALLNLMPDKPTAEAQVARQLGAGRRHVELTLLLPETRAPGGTGDQAVEPRGQQPHHLPLRDLDAACLPSRVRLGLLALALCAALLALLRRVGAL